MGGSWPIDEGWLEPGGAQDLPNKLTTQATLHTSTPPCPLGVDGAFCEEYVVEIMMWVTVAIFLIFVGCVVLTICRARRRARQDQQQASDEEKNNLSGEASDECNKSINMIKIKPCIFVENWKYKISSVHSATVPK